MDDIGGSGRAKTSQELPRWLMVIQGKRLQVTRRRYHHPTKTNIARGEITGFSRKARSRMLRRVASIDWQKVGCGHFLTYTYPDDVAFVGRTVRNKHKSYLHREVERQLQGHVACLWRVEWMPRLTGKFIGKRAPHLHVLYFGVRFISYDFLRTTWQRIIGHVDYASIKGIPLEAADMASVYMAKYCAKEVPAFKLDNEPYGNNVGKAYGWRREELIPYCPAKAIALSCARGL